MNEDIGHPPRRSSHDSPPLTEAPHRRTAALDGAPTIEFLRLMNEEDRAVPEAVGAALERVAEAVDAIAWRLQAGGRLHYFGAGTSGRLALLDAAECPPTFGVEPDVVVGHLAGADRALVIAVEAAEDDGGQGEMDAVEAVHAGDAVVGVSASGETPYVLGALRAARARGALTVALACAADCSAGALADIAIEVVTGPEVVAGSTRLKAGTAQKLVLNMLSTGVFRQLGGVYRGRMVDVLASNAKLRRRVENMVGDLTGAGPEEVVAAVGAAGGRAKIAVAMLRLGVAREEAERRLEAAQGRLDLLLGERA